MHVPGSLPAFQQAARYGTSIELDVIATTDGHPIVHHDDKSGRMFTLPGGDKLIRKSSFQEIRNAAFNQAGHEKTVHGMLGPDSNYQTPAAYRKVNVPELEEVVDTLPDTHFFGGAENL